MNELSGNASKTFLLFNLKCIMSIGWKEKEYYIDNYFLIAIGQLLHLHWQFLQVHRQSLLSGRRELENMSTVLQLQISRWGSIPSSQDDLNDMNRTLERQLCNFFKRWRYSKLLAMVAAMLILTELNLSAGGFLLELGRGFEMCIITRSLVKNLENGRCYWG